MRLMNGTKTILVFIVVFLLLWQLWGLLPFVIGYPLYRQFTIVWLALSAVATYKLVVHPNKPSAQEAGRPTK